MVAAVHLTESSRVNDGGTNPLLADGKLLDDTIDNIRDMLNFLGAAVLADGVGADASTSSALSKCLSMVEQAVEYVEQSIQGKGDVLCLK